MGKSLMKSPLRVLAATSVSIFSLLTVFTSTAAWFDSRRSLDNGANQMEVMPIYDLETLTLYRPTSATPTQYVFGTDQEHISVLHPGESLQSSVFLGPDETPYSPLEPYHPLLCVARYAHPMNTRDGAIHVRAFDADGFVTQLAGKASSFDILSWDKVNELYTIQYSDKTTKTMSRLPLSSIAKFYAKSYEDEKAFLADCSNNYTYATSAIESWNESKFVSVSENQGSFTVTSNDYANILDVTEGTVSVVAFVIEYNVDAINYISSYYMGKEFMNEDLPFACDWTLEV